jgi:hypothetical protein
MDLENKIAGGGKTALTEVGTVGPAQAAEEQSK